MLLVRKSSRRNSNTSSDDDDVDAKKNNDLYQQCVDEIKKEHKILGSIELHQEAMRRLKLRQQSNNSDSNNDIIKQRRPTLEEVYRPKGLSKSTPHLMSQFARSLGNIGDAIRRHSSMPTNDGNNNFDNSNHQQQQQVMAGRRESAALPVGFDPNIISATVMQDLELSDSDSDDNDGELQSISKSKLGKEEDGAGVSSKRSSILRRSSSKLRGSISRMGSFRRTSSVSFGTSGGETSSSDDITDEKINEEEFPENDKEPIINNMPSDFPGVDMAKYTPKSTNKKDVLHRKHPQQRIGRRRSSLFSVDEKRASITEGPPTATCNNFNSSSNNSIGNSITGSLQGSFSGGDIKKDDHDGSSLICSFGRMDSSMNSSINSLDGSGDKLICDWHQRSSMLSDSEVSIDVSGITISDSAEVKE